MLMGAGRWMCGGELWLVCYTIGDSVTHEAEMRAPSLYIPIPQRLLRQQLCMLLLLLLCGLPLRVRRCHRCLPDWLCCLGDSNHPQLLATGEFLESCQVGIGQLGLGIAIPGWLAGDHAQRLLHRRWRHARLQLRWRVHVAHLQGGLQVQ